MWIQGLENWFHMIFENAQNWDFKGIQRTFPTDVLLQAFKDEKRKKSNP